MPGGIGAAEASLSAALIAMGVDRADGIRDRPHPTPLHLLPAPDLGIRVLALARHARAISSSAPRPSAAFGPAEAVEDQVEPELERRDVSELGREVALRVLGEIGVPLRAQAVEQFGHELLQLEFRAYLPGCGVVAELPQREAEDVRVQHVVAVVR